MKKTSIAGIFFLSKPIIVILLHKYKIIVFKVILFLLLSVSVKAQSVYKTPSGAKYHLATCRTVKNVSEKITVSEAKELGLQPCKICKPQNIYSSGSFPNKARGQGVSVQCKGTTKAGNRCRHMTRIANGYCFQHQPD